MRQLHRLPHQWAGSLAALVLIGQGCGSGSGTRETTSGSIILSLSPTSATIHVGGSTTVSGTIVRSFFTGDVAIAVQGAPIGVTGAVTSAPTGGSDAAVVTISATSAATPGTHTLTVVASGSGISNATATFSLTIAAETSSYTESLSSSAQSIAQGTGGTTTVTYGRSNFAGNIAPSVDNLPTGVTASFSANPVTGTSSLLTLTVGATVAAGVYNLDVRGSATGLTDVTTPLTLTVTAAASNTVYDAVNNISWLADANLAATNRFGIPVCNGPGTQLCVNASGSMRYDAATAWVAAMNAANYLGHANWQLPTTPAIDSGCGRKGPNGQSFGFGCTASAFGTLYNALGLKAPNTAVPIPNNTVGPFSNVQPYLYWSQAGAPGAAGKLTFSFATGWQGANTLPNFLYGLPMIPGKLPGTPAATGNGLQVNPGGQTVYDPMTNITWLANANLSATYTFSLPSCTDPITPALCVASDGAMTFASASQFIANMNGASYLGQTNWQLPTIDANCPGYNCAGTQNSMGNLFYAQLGFSQGMTVVTAPNIAVGPFHSIQPYLYWACAAATIQGACETNGPAPNFEWSFSFGSGFEGTDLLANDLYVTVYFVGRSN